MKLNIGNSKTTLTLLTIGTLVLLLVPGIAVALHWQWLPPVEIPAYLFPLYLVTETGTVPYAFVTCIVLGIIPLFYYPQLPARKKLLLVVIMAATLGVGQIVKSTLKNVAQAPRPYIVWLGKSNHINASDFYQLSREERKEFLTRQDFSQFTVPSWQQAHWAKETGFSFPSGHSIFVAQWMLMLWLLLWQKKAYIMMTLIMCWACAIEASRLLLGMHWPQDVMLSCLLAFILIYIARICWNKWVFHAPVP